MSEPQTHAHDDCPDCTRERKENEAFIAIYERLQRVEKRKEEMRQAVRQHRVGADTNRSFYRAVEEKMRSLPRVRQRDDEHVVEKVGVEIAAALLERQSRSPLYAENERLKLVLKRMHRDKAPEYLSVSEVHPQPKPILQQPIGSPPDKLDQTFSSTASTKLALHLPTKDTLQKLLQSQEGSCENSTQSSSFKTTVRATVDLSRYNDMNLWLYQQPHCQLEEELFLPKTQSLRPRPLLPGLPKASRRSRK